MTYRKIVIAGASGYLGRILTHYYQDKTEQIILLSRKPAQPVNNIHTIQWDGTTIDKWAEALEQADLLINLCGKNVNCRYTEKNRHEILSSRVIPTRLLNQAVAQCAHPPGLFINVTSATIYRHAEDHPQDEVSGQLGYGFSTDICKAWEQAFFETPIPGTRKVALRMGIVMGRSDGAFPRMLNLVKVGAGGRQGDGRQYISWIHEQDAAAVTEWLLQHEELEGVINCTAPEPIPNKQFMKAVRTAWGVRLGIPVPTCLLQIGAAVLGTETELLLKSRRVVPKRLLESGYVFSYSRASYAIHDIISIRI